MCICKCDNHDASGQSKNSLSLQLSLRISTLHLASVSHRDENSREREIHRRYIKRSSGSFAAIVSAIRRSVVVPLISLQDINVMSEMDKKTLNSSQET